MLYRKIFKRLFDIVSSLLGLVVLSPALLVLSVAVKIDSPGPAFFKQQRVGINKSRFDMLKLRTMRADAPKNTPTHLLDNPALYITKTGKFLRKTSLDELPQLFNILSGSMSVIGPRPALWNQYDLIEERDKYEANGVRPGLSGWAQVNGRDELPIAVKARYDGEYAKNIRFLFDCRCFFMTIFKVFRRDGVVEGNTEVSAITEISAKTETEEETEKAEVSELVEK